MSTWKKAAKSNQKVHRERHQPANREHLGILEKKKDYKKRAEDQHEKDETLKLLRKRALNKNPDEFYHHMVNSKTIEDEHHEVEKDDDHTPAQIKLMQTQDIKYIIMKRTIEKNKIQRLQSHLHMIDMANEIQNKHIFFVDSEEDAENFDLAKKLDTHPSLLGRKTNRIRMGDLEKLKLDELTSEQMKKLNEDKEKLYRELEKRIDREKELAVIQQKMELKRKLQEKRSIKPKRVKPGTKNSAPIYEFKYERKR
uniref:U3 small nucleolar RNA-associated protein 11 n=1 Tax=Culicoides sonorensis TaxID=179676 RepID=A0A336LL99_CULSO